MQLFYKPGIHDKNIELDENESHHCINVLRMRINDEVFVINGKGVLYKTRLIKPDSKNCSLEIIESVENFDKRDYSLHIAIAPTKSPERFEWFLEKAVEIGVDRITPVVCKHSHRNRLRKERLDKIIVSAVKQSVKATIPILNDPQDFNEFIKTQGRSKFIAICSDQYTQHLLEQTMMSGDDITILIGPEGDFSEEEIQEAINFGFQPVSLGRSRLRTETAGVSVAQMVADYYVIKGIPR
jgi:16S rRNA (uracil1498-N3)-methyltransferase